VTVLFFHETSRYFKILLPIPVDVEHVKIKAAGSFEKSGTTNPATEDCNSRVHRCDNLKTREEIFLAKLNIYIHENLVMKLNKKVDHFIQIYLETKDGQITIFIVKNSRFVDGKSYTIYFLSQIGTWNTQCKHFLKLM